MLIAHGMAESPAEQEWEGRPVEPGFFAGTFRLAEPMSGVRGRVDAAIERALADVPWARRAVGRPLLRSAAHIPQWIRFEMEAGWLQVVLAGRGVVKQVRLRGPLDAAPVRQRLVPVIAGDVLQARVDRRTLRTEIRVDAGRIVNVYQLASPERLEGHVRVESPQLPRPVEYRLYLCRDGDSSH